jgi:transcriptional regulator with XRE-family HTH domain
MNSKLNSASEIKKAFSDKFNQVETDSKHLAQMLSFRFLSEVEKVTDERNILRKDLAKSINVSPSYITQLYRGTKLLNIETLAKIEAALDLRFDVKIVQIESLELSRSDNNKATKTVKAIFKPTNNLTRSRAV